MANDARTGRDKLDQEKRLDGKLSISIDGSHLHEERIGRSDHGLRFGVVHSVFLSLGELLVAFIARHAVRIVIALVR